MQEAEQKGDIWKNQNIRKFIGIGIITDLDEDKASVMLNSGLLDEIQVRNLQIRESFDFCRTGDFPYSIIKKGLIFFSVGIAKEVKEFKDDIGSQVCGLLNDFITRYKCEELFKKPEFIIGIKVKINPKLPEEDREGFSEEIYECSGIGEKFKIKEIFTSEEKVVAAKPSEIKMSWTQIKKSTTIENVLSLLGGEAWSWFPTRIYGKLKTRINGLNDSVFNKSFDVEDVKAFYGEYGNLSHDINNFINGMRGISKVVGVVDYEYLKSDLGIVRKSFESKITVEAQKSMEKSARATTWATGVIAILTLVLIIITILQASDYI